MNEHPLATAVADTVPLRALLPGGPIEEHGRDAVFARFGGWFAGMDTVERAGARCGCPAPA